MNQPLIPVILAGGKGERFWPLSRRDRPKQFLSLDGSGESLLQATAKRLLPLAGSWDKLWVVTAAPIADGIRAQLPELPETNLLVEPEGKDTAPAVAWSALEIAKRHGEEAIAGFFPADHWIGDQGAYAQTLKAAAELASQEPAIVTLGIAAHYPSTGYGYIEQGEKAGIFNQLIAYRVSRFTEKPDQETAENFIETGRYSWNSGMFIFRIGVVLQELAAHAPEILLPLKEKGTDAYAGLEKLSIDYALMEKTQLAYVLPADFGWDDLGDWNSLERLVRGQRKNVKMANHLGLDTEGAIIHSSDRQELIATLGVEDLVIVREGNVTLVAHKNRTQDIKKLLKQIQAKGNMDNFL